MLVIPARRSSTAELVKPESSAFDLDHSKELDPGLRRDDELKLKIGESFSIKKRRASARTDPSGVANE